MDQPVQKIVDLFSGAGAAEYSGTRKLDMIRQQLDSKNVKDKMDAMKRLIEVCDCGFCSQTWVLTLKTTDDDQGS